MRKIAFRSIQNAIDRENITAFLKKWIFSRYRSLDPSFIYIVGFGKFLKKRELIIGISWLFKPLDFKGK
jgi:hypothetical protein